MQDIQVYNDGTVIKVHYGCLFRLAVLSRLKNIAARQADEKFSAELYRVDFYQNHKALGLCAMRLSGLKRIGLIFLFVFSLCGFGLGSLEASGLNEPIISKYGFGPFLSVIRVESPSYSEFQAVGPFIFHESSEKEDVFGIRPLFSRKREKDKGNVRWDLIYPLARFQTGEKEQNYFVLFYRSDTYRERGEKRFYFFPFFWGKTSKGKTYGGVFPLYGHLINRFGKDDIRFFLWPLYSRSEKDGFIRTSFPWPFLTNFSGEKGEGFRFWPFFGHEVKKGIYQKDFLFWPFFFKTKKDMDKDPVERKFFFPFYGRRERPPYYHQTDFLWPVFRTITNDEYHYTRYDAWPVFTRAHGDNVDWWRFFPFYVHRTGEKYEKRVWLWPIYKNKHYWEGKTEVDNTYFMIFSRVLYEREPGQPWRLVRQGLWPLFNNAHTKNGRTWATPDPIPVIYEGYIRNWRPIWTFAGGSEKGNIHRTRILWGLFDHIQVKKSSLTDIAGLVQWGHEGKDIHRFSLLQGLIKYENMRGHASLRFFFLPWRLRWHASEHIETLEEETWELR